jgi:hypothetical protein
MMMPVDAQCEMCRLLGYPLDCWNCDATRRQPCPLVELSDGV